jgi:hypothetical protein
MQSFAEVSDRFDVKWDTDNNSSLSERVNVVNTSDNKAKYTKHEVEMARKARELTQLIGFPSSKEFRKLIKNLPISLSYNHQLPYFGT